MIHRRFLNFFPFFILAIIHFYHSLLILFAFYLRRPGWFCVLWILWIWYPCISPFYIRRLGWFCVLWIYGFRAAAQPYGGLGDFVFDRFLWVSYIRILALFTYDVLDGFAFYGSVLPLHELFCLRRHGLFGSCVISCITTTLAVRCSMDLPFEWGIGMDLRRQEIDLDCCCYCHFGTGTFEILVFGGVCDTRA